MSENIKTRKYYRVHNGTDWDRMHFVTDANSVDANDGDNMETKVGAIKGITTSTSVTEEGYAADATTVAALNDSLDNINIYVGSDGKLHFVNKAGADSALPFSSEPEIISQTKSASKTITMGSYATITLTFDGLSKISGISAMSFSGGNNRISTNSITISGNTITFSLANSSSSQDRAYSISTTAFEIKS